MVKLGTYAAGSALGAAAVVFHAFHSRGQFYPAMLYLANSKLSLVLLCNMALVLLCSVWQMAKVVFLGRLREAEVERLNEQSLRELMEILFAMTIFREEFNVFFLAMVTVLIFVKAFHWLAQKRLEFIETTPAASRLSHARMVSFLVFLFVLDSAFLYSSISSILRTKRPSVALLFAFEYAILAITTVAIFLKYLFYVCDTLLDGQWENKAVFTFYLELVRDLLHLSLYLFFFFVIFVNYGLPLHLVRELYETFRNFKSRVSDFIRYRKLTSNMNERFPDASPEEIARSDATCIICREEMVAAKKLLCGHLFHVHCLRSWLERQQTCPTCRAPVLGSDRLSVGGNVQQQQQLAQGDRERASENGSSDQGPTGMMSSGSSVTSSEEAARLQAAAAAASLYQSSFVYPLLNAGENVGYPMCAYYIPQAYLVPQTSPTSNAEAEPSGNTNTVPNAFNLYSQGLVMLPGALNPGISSLRNTINGQQSPGQLDSSSSSNLEDIRIQQKELQQNIMILQKTLAELQNQLDHPRNDSSPGTEETDVKGKAPLGNPSH